MRLGKNFYFDHKDLHYRLELFAEAFNLLNHQNITSVNTVAYYTCKTFVTSTSPSNAAPCATTTALATAPPSASYNYLIANPLFGTNLNSNSNTVYSQRQIQISGRFHF
jgi:hypothetical protein